MKHNVGTRWWFVSWSIAMIMIVVLASPGLAAGDGVSGDRIHSQSPNPIGNPCDTKKPVQTSNQQSLSSLASGTLCQLENSASRARSLFSGVDSFQYLPWASILVGLVLLTFFALAGWCAWKTKDYRPRRKYHIGRTI